MNLKKIFKKIDIFGIKMDLMVDKKRFHKTNFGAIITLIVIIMISIFFAL